MFAERFRRASIGQLAFTPDNDPDNNAARQPETSVEARGRDSGKLCTGETSRDARRRPPSPFQGDGLTACFVVQCGYRLSYAAPHEYQYPSNLSDAEWACIQRFLPPRSPHGRHRRHCLSSSVFDALLLFCLLHTEVLGCSGGVCFPMVHPCMQAFGVGRKRQRLTGLRGSGIGAPSVLSCLPRRRRVCGGRPCRRAVGRPTAPHGLVPRGSIPPARARERVR